MGLGRVTDGEAPTRGGLAIQSIAIGIAERRSLEFERSQDVIDYVSPFRQALE